MEIETEPAKRPVLVVGSKQTAVRLVEFLRRHAAAEEPRRPVLEDAAKRTVLEEFAGMLGVFGSVGGAGLFGPSLRGPRRPSSNRPRPGTEEAARRLAAAEEKRARKAARKASDAVGVARD